MTTTEAKKPKTDPKESLRREIRFWLKRVDDDGFLKAVRALVRNEGMVKRTVSFESLPEPVRQAILDCDRDIAEDRLYSTEEVFQEIDEWLEKS